MANKELSIQVLRWMGKQSLGTTSTDDINPFTKKLTPEETNRIKRRWTPRVRKAMRGGLEMLRISIERQDSMLAYRGIVDYTVASIFGERGVGAIDWEQPPHIDTPEQRYLVFLSNLGKSFREGHYDKTRRMMKGLTAYYGSNADSGGFPCNPEVLCSLMSVETDLQTILETCPPTPEDYKLGYKLEDQIIEMVQGYSTGKRLRVAKATMNFGEITESYLRHRKIENRFTSIHPLLGRLAHRLTPIC